jgi:hypothetical protein
VKRVVVTGCAGFIGSHLAERLVAEGYRVLRGRCVHALLRAGGQDGEPPGAVARAAVRAAGARPGRCEPRARVRRSGRRLSPRRAAGSAGELRRRLRRLPARQRARHSADLRGRAERRRAPRRLGLVLVGVRRRARLSVPRARDADEAALPVRRHQAHVRAAGRRVPAAASRRRRAALLHGVRPAAAARHGAAPTLRRAARRDDVSALRRRVAVARLHVRRRRGRRHRPGCAPRPASRALQRRRRRGGHARGGDRAAPSFARATLGWRPATRLRDGLRRELEWAGAHTPTPGRPAALEETSAGAVATR